jgi:hypothetical protein
MQGMLAARMRWPIAVGVVSIAGLVTLVSWPSACPIVLKPLSNQPIDMVDDAGQMLRLLTLSVHNPKTVALGFDNGPIRFEAKVGNSWREVPNRWNLGWLRAGGSNEVLLLIPPGADACRFRLRYHYEPGRLPLGIGDCWARVNPPSLLSARVQKATKRLSQNLYDWLWPTQPSPRSLNWKPHWKFGWADVGNVALPSAPVTQQE